jgi:exoribonuclease-2
MSDWFVMKYVVFEENKQLVIANFISKTQDGNHYYVELSSGKQSKIKAKDVIYSCDIKINLDKLEEIDLQLLWECAPNDAVQAQDLANEYFGENNSQNVYSVMQALHKNPIYFSKKGQGFYQKANQEQLNIALQAIEKRKAQDNLQKEYHNQLVQGILPPSFKSIAIDLLFSPNKNSIEWKATESAAKQLNVDVQKLLINLKAIENAKSYHEQLFLREFFPKGTAFNNQPYTLPFKLDSLEQKTDLDVFSIDDSSTTEIDDAFSVKFNENGFELGIHIAAPALGIKINDEFDSIAKQRLSTVYFPHDKITMLPPQIVEAFTLSEGNLCPAISLYMQVDKQFNISNVNTKINTIHVKHNLRYDKLENLITVDAITNKTGDYLYKEEIIELWNFANHLFNNRQIMRQSFGLRPEMQHQTDYSFNITTENDIEKVEIKQRVRGSPLDKIVSELMILANSTWAENINDIGLSGMFRAQKSWGTIRTRMQTSMAPHEGLGVEGYLWATSPLRRYSDLVNQWQIAPFNQKDNDIAYLISMFSDTYASYHEYQSKMERYWCLRWLQQEKIKYTEGILAKDGNIRMLNIPFSIKQPELAQHQRGSIISLELLEIDEVSLEAKARVLSINAPQEP